MSKPKKPGTDLAALKARLAKKTKGADAPAAAPEVPLPGQVAAPAPEVPPPGQQTAAPEVPPPGQPMAAPEVPPPGQPMAAPEVPPPGQPMPAPEPVAAPAPEVPPPGQQYAAPEPQPYQSQAQAPAPTRTEDNPFGTMAPMGGFDPDAGLIDGGPEIKPRGGKGIVLFAAIIAAGVGGVAGWLGNTILSKQERIDAGMAKGEKMVDQVQKISEARKTVSLGMEDLKKDVAQDPAGSADKVGELLASAFDKQPQMSELFGWQLASVDQGGVKAVFKLYDQVAQLQENLGLMSNVLRNYGSVMKVGGPSLYGVTFGPSGARMIAIADSLCGELPEEGEAIDPAALKPCGADSGQAMAYKVIDIGGGDPAILPRGLGEGQAVVLLAEGKVYEYAIGIEQGNNAANFYKLALGRVEESLAEMDKAEDAALKALKKYADDPNVDGPQSLEGGDG